MCSSNNNTFWERELLKFRLHGSSQDVWNVNTSTTSVEMNISNQFKFMSTIPNYHKWCWEGEKNSQLKNEQRFSSCCTRYPGSPRNRIIQALCFRDESHLIVFAVVKCIVGENSEIPYKIIKEMKRQRKDSQKNVKRKSLKEVLRNASQSNSSGSKSDTDGEINDGNLRNFPVVLLFLYLIICLFMGLMIIL